MATFNSTVYDASGVSYNTERPVYIDGTTATIPVNGTKYFNGLFGNVMCSFINDGGDSILGGNVIVSGNLNVGGNLNVLNATGNTLVSTKSLSYLSGITSNVQTQLTTATNSGTSLLAAANAWTGTNTFNSSLPTSTQAPSSATQLTTKAYVDSAVLSGGGTSLLSAANAWTGTNTFNISLPTSTQNPSSATQLTTKAYVDSAVSSGGGTSLLSAANAWTGTNKFAEVTTLSDARCTGILTHVNYPPNCSITPIANVHLCNKAYVDSVVSSGGGTSLLSAANTWTGLNTFNISLPTSTKTPGSATELTTKAYVDSVVSSGGGTSLLSAANTWTGASNRFGTLYAQYLNVPNLDVTSSLNVLGAAAFSGTSTFNSSLPTSTQTPSSATQLTTKAYVDNAVSTGNSSLLAATNTWTASNSFTGGAISLYDNKLYLRSSTDVNHAVAFSSLIDGVMVYGSSGASMGTVYNPTAIKVNSLFEVNVPAVFAGTSTFNSSLPTSTKTPASATELTTKAYVDTAVATRPNTPMCNVRATTSSTYNIGDSVIMMNELNVNTIYNASIGGITPTRAGYYFISFTLSGYASAASVIWNTVLAKNYSGQITYELSGTVIRGTANTFSVCSGIVYLLTTDVLTPCVQVSIGGTFNTQNSTQRTTFMSAFYIGS